MSEDMFSHSAAYVFMSAISSVILNISNSPVMPGWHYLHSLSGRVHCTAYISRIGSKSMFGTWPELGQAQTVWKKSKTEP